jgi:hypothetical protein
LKAALPQLGCTVLLSQVLGGFVVTDIEILQSGLLGQIKVLTSEVKSLVALLTSDQKREWFAIHQANCYRQKIDPVTGLSIKDLGPEDLERDV